MRCFWILALLLYLLLPSISAAEDTQSDQSSQKEKDYPGELLDIVKRQKGSLYSYRKSYIGYSVYNNDTHDTGELKFQFSFKYQLLKERDPENEKWYNNLYFGYTQKSIWSIQKLSSPFKENNYSPELFYIFSNPNINFMPYMIFGIAKHESNGEAGTTSRGWNLTYLEPFFPIGNHLVISTKIWAPLFFLGNNRTASDNPDIFRYLGYGEIGAKYRIDGNTQLSSSFRQGDRIGRYGVEGQLDLDLATFQLLKNDYFQPTVFVQVWNGFGETLKTYNSRTTNVIVGISAVR